MEQFKVDDILVGTWGYSMVIPEFFEVKKVNAKTATVRRLAKKMLKPNACGQQGYEVPVEPRRSDERDFEGTARMTESGWCVKMEYGTRVFVEKWNEQPVWADYMD